MMIRLIGPGGAGKSTVGFALSKRLGIPFIDLDEQFTIRIADISAFLSSHSYCEYANRNIQIYLDVVEECRSDMAVFALSSGFLTYPVSSHREYPRVYREVLANRSTVALLPSFDLEACVAETLRRQLGRPFSRSAEREEQVIRSRFRIYSCVPQKFETTKPLDGLVDEMTRSLQPIIRH